MQALVFGYSHVFCLEEAVRQAQPDRRYDEFHILDIRTLDPSDQEKVFRGSSKPIVDSAIAAREGRPSHWISLVGGNDHNVLSLMEHPKRFDFTHPHMPGLPIADGAEILTYGYVKDAFKTEPNVVRWLRLLESMKADVEEPILHLEPPPPKGDDDFIRANLDRFFTEKFGHDRIVSRALRLKIWRTYCDAIREKCEQFGVQYIDNPSTVFDAEGYLARDGYEADATHGNVWYGAKLLDGLRTRLFSSENLSVAT